MALRTTISSSLVVVVISDAKAVSVCVNGL
jgi:hypothetical protein